VTKRLQTPGADSLRPLRRENGLAPEDAEIAASFSEPLPPFSEIAAARIRRRLEQERAHAGHRPAFPMWLKVTVGVAASLFLLETAAAAAISAWPAMHDRFWAAVAARMPPSGKQRLPAEPAAAIPSPSPNLAAPPGAAERGAEPPAPIPSVPPNAAADATAPPPRHLAAPHPVGVAPARPEPAAHSESLDDELALYLQALEQLNRDRAPTLALSTLSAYRFKHPDGVFRGEATVAEIKAQLLLGRDAEVLALLDVMHEQGFAGVPQKSEVGLLRAELLARSARCEDALKALDPYLEPSLPADQRERALFSRASCRAQLKDFEGSRNDLRTYLREFPQGRFAAKAVQTLNSLP